MLSITDQLIHSTVKIDCLDAKAQASSGTGFVFNFFDSAVPSGQQKTVFPALVTNKHVVKGQQRGFLHLTLADADGKPIYGQHQGIELSNFAQCWIDHPDPEVDLAICMIAPLIQQLAAAGKRVFYVGIPGSLIPDAKAAAEQLHAVEDILMIGYPRGLWDSKNNLPIVRRGITATPVYHDYEGRSEFFIDAACFPGSSGSPIFIVNQGMVIDRNGGIRVGASRIMFLGVLHAGPQITLHGDIVIEDVPTTAKAVPVISTMMNLGLCIKAARVLDFEAILRSKGVKPDDVSQVAAVA